VPHHLIDVADITEAFDAAKFAKLAEKAVREIQARGQVPILCGGTGLYFKAFVEGLGDAPAANPDLRAELESAALADLLHELEQRDPETFTRIDKQNPRRVIRAVEVIRLTGKAFSSQRADWNAESKPPEHYYCFTRDAADLHARINLRIDRMFAGGLVDETRRLLERGLEKNKTAMQAIGYRQVVEHLRGERSLDETIELVKIRTRQFAKRQLTWFRKQIGIKWIELAPGDKPDVIVGRLKLD
jgi:tRNA dimethylallyltransferase